MLSRLSPAVSSKTAIDTLPRLKGGRPPAFPPETECELLDFVSKLQRNGLRLQLAQQRAATRFHSSLRTVERLWKNRGIPPEKPVNPEDVVAFFTSED